MNKRLASASMAARTRNKQSAPEQTQQRRSSVRPVLALAAAISSALLFAASPLASAADSRIISYKEAVRIALEHNATLRQAENAAALSEIAVQEARMQFVPDLRLSTSGSQSYGRNFSEAEGRIIDQSTRSMSVGISSGLTVFDGFRNYSNLRSARLNSTASQLTLGRTQETVIFTVASNYLALIQQQEQLRVQRENLATEAALEAQVQTYVDAGARTVADLYQQQAVVASARLSLVNAERAAELAKLELIQTLQLDPLGIYEFAVPQDAAVPTTATTGVPADAATGSPTAPPTLPGQSPTSNETLNLDGLVSRALSQRHDLSAEQIRVSAAEQSVRSARAGRWPSVSLSAGYNSGYSNASPLAFGDQLDLRRGGSIGLGVSIPLFDRNNVRNATRRAELQVENARISLENTRQDVSVQVRRAYLDYQTAQEQLTAAEAQFRASQLATQTTEQRYKAGAATLLELSQARARDVQAASSLVSARYNLLFQRTLVDYYAGDLKPASFAQ